MEAARGRGADLNPHNRFDALKIETDEDAWVDDDPRPLRTTFLKDHTQSILNPIESDDLSHGYGLNSYRGCEHGCAYCFARVYHEFLGFSSGLDFESKIVVKSDAPGLLEKALAKSSYRPANILMSGATDCYQPVERKLGITRRCLEVLSRFRNPAVIITKNALVTRDIDYLSELARHRCVVVYLSITTLDPKLARILEPRASSPRAKLETLKILNEAGIPAGVSAAPLIPGLNDSELPAILKAVAEHGGKYAAYSFVRLPGTVSEVFSNWLDRHRPDAKEKILSRIRGLHDGNLDDFRPVKRMRGTGQAAEQWRALFHVCCRKCALQSESPELNLAAFRRQIPGQGELFD